MHVVYAHIHTWVGARTSLFDDGRKCGWGGKSSSYYLHQFQLDFEVAWI